MQKYYPFKVDSIKIIGNEITDEDIITRELNFAAGDSIDYKDIQYNRDRVFSLGIFNRVDIYSENHEGKNLITIDLEESWYIYPLPFIELKDKSWDKISYGFFIFVKNFRGRNETLGLACAFGYDPSFSFNYTVPSLTTDGNYYLFTDIYYRQVMNKSKYAFQLAGEEFSQKMFAGSIGFGRRFGLFHRLSLSVGYSIIDNPFFIPGISSSDQRIDRYPMTGLNYIFDTRDLAQFPTDGTYFNSSVNFKGLGVNDINYQIVNFDYRNYVPVTDNLFAKWRLAGRLGFGEVPTYDYSFLGFGERVRGFYSDETEGYHLYMISAELFYAIIKEFNINLDFIPLIPDELLHYRAGLYCEIFTDAGTTLPENSSITYNDFKSGYGIGLTFLLLPYNIFRVEFAINEVGSTQWLVDFGISF